MVNSISVRDVTGVVETNLVNVLSTVSNGMMQLSWPPDHIGWTLQQQINDLTKGLGTNWVNVAGSTAVNSESIPISRTNGSVFFRLKYP